ncbi:MAG: MoaD/ThiS family protein [Flavobacteriales bacterium CG_4_9_14_3_um_filter_32_8]|nr:MAG: MoaD/ThiS family protein [Flavobacteriales bacterium CG_4_9_14_3_um_filter_32_8]
MKLAVKYFGMIAEAIGKQEEQLEITGNSVLEVDVFLKNKYAKLEFLNYKFAVNQVLVDGIKRLKENDEIALLPPFAGG